MAKLLPLLVVSLIWFFIGWISHTVLGSAKHDMKLLAEQQRIVDAHQILQSRQLLPIQRSAEISVSDSLADAAIVGMLQWSQDKYADLYGPLATKQFLADYQEGIGITNLWFDVVDDQRIVRDVPPGSAADLAGIEVGDVLLGIDGFDVSQSVGGYEIATLLRGPVGSTYKLTIRRGDQTMTRTVTREAWAYLSSQIIENHIGYLKTEYFVAGEMEEAIRKIMKEFSQANIQALIWDLRNNSGGSPTVAEEVMNYFQVPNTVLYLVEFKDGTRRTFSAKGNPSFAEIPIVLLINEQTWSAGEIVAAAMVQRESTILMGTTTAGKGLVQDTVPLDETHMLHFTVAKWLTPLGEWIHETGIDPTIPIEDDPTTNVDEALEMAIHHLQRLLSEK